MKQMVQSLSAAIFAASLVACSPQAMETETKTKKEEEDEAVSINWSYTGDKGPESWGELDQAYGSCVNGSEQSPINIEFPQLRSSETGQTLDIQYEAASFSLINNGHTIQINNASESNKMILDGTDYQLVQLHFHTPSEHRFDGQEYAMELHLVHQNENEQLAVLGVMIQEGAENETLQSMWAALPEEKMENAISIDEPLNLQELIPQEQSYLYYNGSLTTPPCTEQVKWVLLEQAIDMSKEQIEAFQQIFPYNNRPVQPLNEREIIKN